MKINKKICVVWFRKDLRLDDHPALSTAAAKGFQVLPLFIHDPSGKNPWAPGAASRWWLQGSLKALQSELKVLGSRIILRQGEPLSCLQAFLHETGAKTVYYSRAYEPFLRDEERKTENTLRTLGIETCSFPGSLLFEPEAIRNRQGRPFQVFTAFWNHLQTLDPPTTPLRKPSKLLSPSQWPKSLNLEDFKLLPAVTWYSGMEKNWNPGTEAARQNLFCFKRQSLKDYPQNRDFPDPIRTSKLSPYLSIGSISPRQVWHAIVETGPGMAYRRQLAWREFAAHLLYHFPETAHNPLKQHFNFFQWEPRPREYLAWQQGKTGYPLVDAGMRELWQTGWMHNRVRMVVASFLIKDLLVPWQEGAKWFWETLVDADLANNTLGWQWAAGSGADAAPFFRIFNPAKQGEKFDSNGNYVRCWVPELAKLPVAWIHKPWLAPASVLEASGVHLGENYPVPIIDHEFARRRALHRFAALQKEKIVKS